MEFRDLKTQYKKYRFSIRKNVNKVFKEASFIGGQEVGELEKKLQNYVGVKHCISCANGTDAMTLVLDAWGIHEGDAVFVPDFTYFATVEVVSQRKATPIFVDVLQSTFNMDPVSLEKQIQRVIKEGKLKPKVVITVDLFGLPADYPQINPIAKKYGLKVLEDSAQGFGGEINGKKACSFADAATTSFFPAKPLGCYGDGGAIFTNDDTTAKLIQSLKVHGKGEDKYDNVRIGYNSRLDTIQAAILLVKFKAFVMHELSDVQRVYQYYNQNLNHTLMVKPIIPTNYLSSFAQYTIILKDQQQRDFLQKELKKKHIPTFIYYSKAMHQQKAMQIYQFDSNDLLTSTYLAERVLSLPMHPYLNSRELKSICNNVNNILQSSD
jgi:UDP-2-acetamido-2-deoxy-ribo-hexuluronate aminotransferase